jgi:hypothetical protein
VFRRRTSRSIAERPSTASLYDEPARRSRHEHDDDCDRGDRDDRDHR